MVTTAVPLVTVLPRTRICFKPATFSSHWPLEVVEVAVAAVEVGAAIGTGTPVIGTQLVPSMVDSKTMVPVHVPVMLKRAEPPALADMATFCVLVILPVAVVSVGGVAENEPVT